MTVQARPGNPDQLRSAALMDRGAKHPRAEELANDARPGAMLRGDGPSVPRGVRIEKTTVRARPGNRGHSGSPVSKGRGTKHPRAEELANDARPGAMLPGERPERAGGVRIEKTRAWARPGNRGLFGKPGFKGPRREAPARGGTGERRAPRSDAPGDRPQRAEKRPYRKDDGAGEPGKPRSFGKPGLKGPRREAPARGGTGERRAPWSDAPGDRPQRAERRPYRKDDGAGEGGKPRSFVKPGFKGPRREAPARGQGGKPSNAGRARPKGA